MSARVFPLVAGLVAAASTHAAQQPAFRSPGQPSYFLSGQVNRFSNEFNPALGGVLDMFADGRDDDVQDGFDLQLRILELNASGFVDPKAWAYIALVSENGESPAVEEAAVNYIGWEGNSTLKAGRFFVDFGKQMQSHLEELRSLERPLVLREFLGEELSGDGVQFDHWFAANESTPVRFSLGAFASLLGDGHGHGDEDEGGEPEAAVPERHDFDELSFTARLTGMTDVGDTGQVQLGASARWVPEFSFAFDGLERTGLSSGVYGLDATYGWSDETGNGTFSTGAEWLLYDGDLSAEVDDPLAPTVLSVNRGSATGFFAWADRSWGLTDSAGVQFSSTDLVEDTTARASELDLYFTRHYTHLRRIRLGVTLGDSDLGGDFLRVYVQFTNFFGTHSHGLNW